MMRATLTIMGMYEWDNTLFDGMSLPNNVQRETMIDNILSGEQKWIALDDYQYMENLK